MRLLLTRPEERSGGSKIALEALGHAVLLEPLLTIQKLPVTPPDLAGFQALIFTSITAVETWQQVMPGQKSLPVFAVGEKTAKAAKAAGFPKVLSAEGDSDDLAKLILEKIKPEKGALLHPCAKELAGDLRTPLRQVGLTYETLPLYESVMSEKISDRTLGALRRGEIDAVLFFSPRSAKAFARLCVQQGLATHTAQLYAYCLSAAVAEELREVAWRDRLWPTRPNEKDLFALLPKE